MSDKKTKNIYDDGNIPDIDLPQSSAKGTSNSSSKNSYGAESLPESSRPRKDGPGGE